jgi:hypothetical protein
MRERCKCYTKVEIGGITVKIRLCLSPVRTFQGLSSFDLKSTVL